MNYPQPKNIVNLFYHASILATISSVIAMSGKKLFGTKLESISKFDPLEIGKLSVVLTASLGIQQFLIKEGLLPEDIMK